MLISNLKIDYETTKISIGGIDCEVKQYLPIKQKIAMINSIEKMIFDKKNLYYNPAEADALLFASIVVFYTDLEFKQNEKDNYKEHLLKIYDYLEANGFISLVLEVIPEEELKALLNYEADTLEKIESYNMSLTGLMEKMVLNLPALSENLGELLGAIKNDPDVKELMALYNDNKDN